MVKMIEDLRKRMEAQTQRIQKCLIKSWKLWRTNEEQYINWKSTWTESVSRINEAEEWVGWKTDWWKPLLQYRIKNKRMKRNEDSISDLWDNVNTPCIPGVPEREGHGKIFEEILTENFPNLGRNSHLSWEVQRVPYRRNLNNEHTKTNTNQIDQN